MNKTELYQVLDSRADVNSWVRRFFRLWMDGSYQGNYPGNRDGYETYLYHMAEMKRRAAINRTSIRTFMRIQFNGFLAAEFTPDSTGSSLVWKEVQKYFKSAEEFNEFLDVLAQDTVDNLFEGEYFVLPEPKETEGDYPAEIVATLKAAKSYFGHSWKKKLYNAALSGDYAGFPDRDLVQQIVLEYGVDWLKEQEVVK